MLTSGDRRDAPNQTAAGCPTSLGPRLSVRRRPVPSAWPLAGAIAQWWHPGGSSSGSPGPHPGQGVPRHVCGTAAGAAFRGRGRGRGRPRPRGGCWRALSSPVPCELPRWPPRCLWSLAAEAASSRDDARPAHNRGRGHGVQVSRGMAITFTICAANGPEWIQTTLPENAGSQLPTRSFCA
jgi:hypothetical protein